MRKVQIGVIGCGSISSTYLNNFTTQFTDIVQVKAVADLNQELAKAQAARFSIPQACTVAELLADPAIEIIVNLTSPKAHASVSKQVLLAGKHLYNEKPFTVAREEAQEVLALAESKGLRVGGAPDTFLGSGLQACRALVDEGAIGRPLYAHASIAMIGVSHYDHPNPAAFLGEGGGPLFDMAPYFLTALIAIFGSINRVSGSAKIVAEEVTIVNESSPHKGKTFHVESVNNVTGVLDFANGMTASLTALQDTIGYHPKLVVYGTEGILHMNDPNQFGGTVQLERYDAPLKEIHHERPMSEDARGAGVADMARAILDGGVHRASGTLAYHVLETIHGIQDASLSESYYHMKSRAERPESLGSRMVPREWSDHE